MTAMEVKELRRIAGMSQTAFARAYGIPLRTYQRWESGESRCPQYVFDLLARAVREDWGEGVSPQPPAR